MRDVYKLKRDGPWAVDEVEISYLPNDDLVLELAVNGLGLGEPVTGVTCNQRDFLPHADKFGVGVITPRQFFQGV